MANKNFGGLGISFYAESDKARQEVSRLEQSIESIEKVLNQIKDVKAFDTIVSAVSLTKLDKLAEKLDRVGDSASSNVQLSSSLDSTFAQAGKSANQLAAGAGLSASALKKMKRETSFFYDLNIDAKGVQDTFIELNRAGIDLKKLGFSSLKEFTKFAQVAGVEGKVLVENLRLLKQSYGFSDSEAKMFLDRTVKIGTELGFGAEAVQGMSGVLTVFDEKLRSINPNITAKEMTKLNDQVLLLAGAMVKTGDKPADAIQKATNLFANLADTRKDFDNLAQGVGVDLPDMLKKLNLSMGDFASANDLIRSDPLKVVQALSKNYSSLTKDQKKFVDSNLLQSLGASPDWLVKGNYAKVANEIERVSKSLDKAAGSSNKMAKAFRTGLTDQERFNRLQEKFSARLTGLARKQGVQSKFLELNRKAYKAIGDTLEDLSKSKGPLGAATRAFLAFKVAGIQGVAISIVDSLRTFKFLDDFFDKNEKKVLGLTGAFAAMAPQILAVAAALKFLGFRFSALFMGPLGFLGLGAAVIGGLYLMETKFEGGIKGFVNKAETYIKKNFPKIKKFIKDGIDKAIKIIPKIMEGGGYLIAKGLNGLSKLIDKVDWNDVGQTAGKWVAKALTFAFDFAFDVVAGLFGSDQTKKKLDKGSGKMAYTVRDQLVNAFVNIGKSALGALAGAIGGMFEKAFEFLLDPNVPAAKKAKAVGKVIGGFVVVGLGLALFGKAGMIGVAGMLAKGLMKPILGLLKFAGGGSIFKGIFRTAGIIGGIMALVTAIKEIPKAWGEATKLINKSSEMSMNEMNDSGYKMASSFAKILNMAFLGIPGMIAKSLGLSSDKFRTFYDWAVMQTEIFIGKFMLVMNAGLLGWQGVFDAMSMAANMVFIGIKDIGGSAFYSLLSVVATVFEKIENIFNIAHKAAKTFFELFKHSGKLTLLNLEIGFTSFKNVVLYDVLAPIVQGIESFFVDQILSVQKMMKRVPKDLLPGPVKTFLKLDVDDVRLTKGTMFDPENIRKDRLQSEKKFKERRSALNSGLVSNLAAIQSDKGSQVAAKYKSGVLADKRNFSQSSGQKGAEVLKAYEQKKRRSDQKLRDLVMQQQSMEKSARKDFSKAMSDRDSKAALAKTKNMKPDVPVTRSAVPSVPTTTPVKSGDSSDVADVNSKGFTGLAKVTRDGTNRIVKAIKDLGKKGGGSGNEIGPD